MLRFPTDLGHINTVPNIGEDNYPQIPVSCSGAPGLHHVFTRHDETVFDVGVDPAGIISDHSFITWKLHFISQLPRVVWNTFRCWKKVDHFVFQQALRESELCRETPDHASPDTLFVVYDEVVRKLADRFTPLKKSQDPTSANCRMV